MNTPTVDELTRLMAQVDQAIAERNPELATALADRMIAMAGQSDGMADAWFAKAKAALAGGNASQALDIIEELLKQVQPVPAPLHLLHGNALLSLGSYPAAVAALQKSLMLDPTQWLACSHLARALCFTDDLAGALSVLEHAARQFPGNADSWFELGAIHLQRRDWDKARICMERARNLRRDHEGTLLGLATAYAEMGRTTDALVALRGDSALPKPAMALPTMSLTRWIREALMLPQIYADMNDLNRWRDRYQDNLSALHAAQPGLLAQAADVFDLNHVNFLLAYQGRHDRSLQESCSAWLHGLIEASRPDLLAPLPRRKRQRRIKVAFVSSMLRQCTVGHYFKHWVWGLDGERFETHLVHLGDGADAVTQEIGSRCASFAIERGKVRETADGIRAREFDVIVYPEIGMCSDTFMLSQLRLAPLQCCAWGHPVTTGNPRMDCYFTCAEMEPPDHGDHYTESLLPLPGIGTFYELPEMPPKQERAALGLPDAGRLYVCSQSLFKIHPDNDAVFLDILATDEAAHLLFFQAESPAVTRQFAERLQRGMAARGMVGRNQIRFLPRTSASQFRAILAAADVVLDTLHFSGGNTSLDALSVGAPLVTLPGQFMRGRQSMAMLKALGLTDLVVASRQAYVAMACAIAANPDQRQDIRKTCLQGREAIFGRRDALAALSDQLEMAYVRQCCA